MILNSYIIAYLVCSFFSLLIGLVSAINGFYVQSRWDITNQEEEQYRLEKRVYLIITLVSLGLLLRLLMIPVWFCTLHSMIISIPGAMCLIGVHNITTPYSYLASSLKLVLLPLYGYWLILNLLDRQVVTQPFMKHKLRFLTPLGMLILCETILDASFLLSVPPRQVSCCTSLFDVPRENILPLVSQSTWLWFIMFYGLILFIWGELLYFFVAQRRSTAFSQRWWFGNKTFMFLQTLVIVFTFVVFILALHTKISPLFLHLPFHHCVFCLGQEVWDALLSFSMLSMGLTFFLIYFWVVSSVNYSNINLILTEKMLRLLKWSGAMLTGGIIILSIHLLLSFRC
jgi:hypothetical protein